ncbi:MAG: PDZ domain-containing protein [Verrucomicrobiales bacterium]
MKTILILPLLAANAVAADLAAPPISVPADTPVQISILDSVPQNVGTAVSVDVKDGKSTITITVEKDGKRETKTLVLPENTPLDAVTEKIAQELQSAGASPPAPGPENKVTYLGVMLDEPAAFLYGAGAGLAPGFDHGSGTATGGGSAGAAAHPGLPPGTGLTVSGITPGSPAESAGLKPGDILAKLNDQILVNPGQFTTLIRNMKEGGNVTLTYLRDGQEARSQATLASRLESPIAGGGLGGSGFATGLARVLTLDPHGNVIETRPGAPILPVPPIPPGTPPAPPSPPDLKPLFGDRPAWENTLREAAATKDKAAAHWQEQLSRWRAEWTESQQKATEEYRRAVEKMSREVAKAREAADQAREEARRAVEDAMRKIEEKRGKTDPKPDSPEAEPAKPAEPKNA